MKKIKGSGNLFDHYLGKYGGKLLFQNSKILHCSTSRTLSGQNLITKTITSILPPHVYRTTLTLESKIVHSFTDHG